MVEGESDLSTSVEERESLSLEGSKLLYGRSEVAVVDERKGKQTGTRIPQ
jgi:hypothetical protein